MMKGKQKTRLKVSMVCKIQKGINMVPVMVGNAGHRLHFVSTTLKW